MRIKKAIIAAILALGLLGGQALSVGAWNGNTAAGPETYECTRINTTPGNLGGFRSRFGSAAFGLVEGRVQSYTTCTTVSALYD